MKTSLQDKVILISGASRGIGAATARLLAKHKTRLVLGARHEAELLAVARETGALPIVLDVTKDADCERFVAAAYEKFGSVDILVNNAGVGLWGAVNELTPETLGEVMDVNVYGPVRLIRRVTPIFRRQGEGRIINVSSVLGHRSLPMSGGYCATKFALHALNDALRVELAPENIGVSLICPGQTNTAFKRDTRRAPEAATDRPDRGSSQGQSAEMVAHAIVRACRTGTREIDLSPAGRAMILAEKLAPRVVDLVLGRAFRAHLPARPNSDQGVS